MYHLSVIWLAEQRFTALDDILHFAHSMYNSSLLIILCILEAVVQMHSLHYWKWIEVTFALIFANRNYTFNKSLVKMYPCLEEASIEMFWPLRNWNGGGLKNWIWNSSSSDKFGSFIIVRSDSASSPIHLKKKLCWKYETGWIYFSTPLERNKKGSPNSMSISFLSYSLSHSIHIEWE